MVSKLVSGRLIDITYTGVISLMGENVFNNCHSWPNKSKIHLKFKLFPQTFDLDPQILTFYQNYKDHENIVKLYSFFMAGRKAYMVMELLQGREVFDLICDDNHFEVLTESVLKSGSQTSNFRDFTKIDFSAADILKVSRTCSIFQRLS